MFTVDSTYISCACNRTPHSADWGYNDLVCFASCHAVAIYSPKKAQVLQTLCFHKARVNCVRWIRKPDESCETEFLSCSCDKTVIVWSPGKNGKYLPSSVLEGHKDSVTVSSGIYVRSDFHERNVSNSLLLATGSVDSSVKIWLRKKDKGFLCFQSIDCATGFALCLCLTYLPQTSCVLLLIATDDSKIHLYLSDLQEEFKKVHSLIGHEDWVRALDVTIDGSNNLLIASGSQDAMIRLWQIVPKDENKIEYLSKDVDIQPERKSFKASKKTFLTSVESVLSGHDGWIYSVRWHVKKGDPNIMKLLSASIDKSIIVWSPDPQTGMWLETVRVGDMGGNTLGFYGAMFSPDGLNILGHGYQGSFHLWSHNTNTWEPKVATSGHFQEVVDMQWEPNGNYLLSVSKDQTTRLHAPWIRGDKGISWHEIARPQIHGYDMSSVAIISPTKFASGAEEKIIRVFEAPNNFIENFIRLCQVKLNDKELTNVPRGASVPSLGLSNKAVYGNAEFPPERHVRDEYPDAYFVPIELKEPPTEELLMQNTLWPEIQKLYGHGYEIFTLGAHPKRPLLASTCKASNSEHAAIIIWNTSNWQQLQTLISHQLTVTQLSFSPNGKYLLSVSRDRLWSLFEESGDSYKLVSKTTNKTGVHSRIIWTCSWSGDSRYFATGSRDGKLCVWESESHHPKCVSVLELKGESITAVAFNHECDIDHYILAVGLETGCIKLYQWTPGVTTWKEVGHLDKNEGHHLAVKRLAFRPTASTHLASCSADGSVKIHVLSSS